MDTPPAVSEADVRALFAPLEVAAVDRESDYPTSKMWRIHVGCSPKQFGKFIKEHRPPHPIYVRVVASAKRGEIRFTYPGTFERIPNSWLPKDADDPDPYSQVIRDLRVRLNDAGFNTVLKPSQVGGGLRIDDSRIPFSFYIETDDRFNADAVFGVFYAGSSGAFRKNESKTEWLTIDEAVDLVHRAADVLGPVKLVNPYSQGEE